MGGSRSHKGDEEAAAAVRIRDEHTYDSVEQHGDGEELDDGATSRVRRVRRVAQEARCVLERPVELGEGGDELAEGDNREAKRAGLACSDFLDSFDCGEPVISGEARRAGREGEPAPSMMHTGHSLPRYAVLAHCTQTFASCLQGSNMEVRPRWPLQLPHSPGSESACTSSMVRLAMMMTNVQSASPTMI